MDPSKKQYREVFWELMEARREQYKEIPMILKDASGRSGDINRRDLPDWLAGELIVSCDANYNQIVGWDGTVEKNEKLLQSLKSNGLFDQKNGIQTLYRKRGSISYIIHLGVMLGYDEIILCGVDMVDSKYYFDVMESDEINVPIPRHSSSTNDASKESTHKTNDRNVGSLTLEKIIYSMNDIVLEPKNIDLYVENEKSALYSKIPNYQYERDCPTGE
jgi:hypothetical protein